MVNRELLVEELEDSGIRVARWIVGGAAGGLLTGWVVADWSDVSLVAGVLVLFALAIVVDMWSKFTIGVGFGD